MVVMDILVSDILVFMVVTVVFMVMESVRLRLSPRLLLTLGIMEDMATLDLDLDLVVMDILVLDILVFMVVTVVFMVMESVRLKLSPRLLLTPGCMEDMATLDLDLDMEVMDIPVLDILVLDILAFMVMDGVAKKYLKSRTPIHTDCHIPFCIVHKLSE